MVCGRGGGRAYCKVLCNKIGSEPLVFSCVLQELFHLFVSFSDMLSDNRATYDADWTSTELPNHVNTVMSLRARNRRSLTVRPNTETNDPYDFFVVLTRILPEMLVNPYHVPQRNDWPTNDSRDQFISEKRSSAISAPSRDWCRMLGYTVCPRSSGR